MPSCGAAAISAGRPGCSTSVARPSTTCSSSTASTPRNSGERGANPSVRIAFIVGGFPMISESWILAQVTALLDRGHEVDLYAKRESEESVVHADVADYGLMGRSHWFKI